MEMYSESFRVTPSHIKQDKIDIELSAWVLTGDINTYAAFMRYFTGEDSLYGWAFTSRVDDTLRATRIAIRSAQDENRPLFSGIIKINRIVRDGGDFVRAYFSPVISINPTRYLWYQPMVNDIEATPELWQLPASNLRAHLSSRRRLRTEEWALDGKDNVLLGQWNTLGRPEAWPIHLRRYLNAIVEFFDSAFRASVEVIDDLTIEREPQRWRINLKSAESYVEFTPPDGIHPIAWVRSVEDIFRSVSSGTEARDFEVRERESSEANSRFIRLLFPDNRELRVYAKTNSRVRMEVFHDFTKHHANVLHRQTNSESHTAREIGQIARWLLDGVATNTSLLINHALERIQGISNAPRGFPPYMLASTIYRTCGVRYGHTVLITLAINRRIVLSRKNDYLRPCIRKLVSQHVLERTGMGSHDHVFSVTAPYARALSLLSSHR